METLGKKLGQRKDICCVDTCERVFLSTLDFSLLNSSWMTGFTQEVDY